MPKSAWPSRWWLGTFTMTGGSAELAARATGGTIVSVRIPCDRHWMVGS